ncbi:MAG: RES family NAD+ phosphorylase [Actinobacteria bacterium]|nr:RES family NAD+ phosphorylase [Actinomycetota bacterium]MCB9389374.1 RES family NAD+ phosphorylase [Acidimicrobiia bacterium]
MTSLDPKAVARAPRLQLQATGFRNQAKGYDPRSGEGARRFGGRFNPPRSFPVLYLCTTRACVAAELTRQATRQNVDVSGLLPRELWQFDVDLEAVLDLTNPAVMAAISVTAQDLVRDDVALTQHIGEAAYEHGCQAIRNRSATGVDDVLAIFPENLAGADLHIALLTTWTQKADLAD